MYQYIIMETYIYKAIIESIYDGDTITCTAAVTMEDRSLATLVPSRLR